MARTPRLAAGRARALGLPTRGTTNPNRLRRVDRWVAHAHRDLLAAGEPLVVDLGYGSSPVTTVELAARLRAVNPRVRVLGLELDPERVEAGRAVADPPGLDFRRGGFELAGARPVLLRAFNVLRQYTEEQAAEAWTTMVGRLAPGGVLVEGTCDEVGRRCCWVSLTAEGPRTFTLSCLPADLDTPGDLAERLPKALIHHNVPGEKVHALLAELDACWATAAPYAPYGPRARWVESVRLLAGRGWPVLDDRKRWRLGEITVPWEVVGP
ncbi:class I SAM-dependent methyltransferase [Saccharothrix syringae]|uniref:Class I SAM-dependent methyltransferase n=1 Tax=Saccharothrix syringae TaxID=103733 RepID=A0A5Q0HBI9_SACSY|nr:methylase [Saccharothrix syringae]QFZ23618.1 class I SAM-dependent methyltransferase [Saccharothrix syringae]